MDKNKLLYFIKDRGYRVEDFCNEIGMTYSKFYDRCRHDRFMVCEIRTIAKFLNLTIQDIDSIFFAEMVS